MSALTEYQRCCLEGRPCVSGVSCERLGCSGIYWVTAEVYCTALVAEQLLCPSCGHRSIRQVFVREEGK